MSRKFEAELDTQREYFNATYFNKSGQNQIAKYETTLLKPFFQDPDKWKLAINRFRVPISQVPLTSYNVPFNAWEVGIQYATSAGDAGTEQFEYVQQYNPITQTDYLYENLASYSNYQLATTQPYVIKQFATIPNIDYSVLPVVDSTNNTNTFFVLNTNGYTIDAYQGTPSNASIVATFPITGSTLIPAGQTFHSIATICTDASGNFYIGYKIGRAHV